jgi:hypothetical protein
MKAPFIIYCRAVGLYALFTLPAMVIPEMYFISLMYVLLYGSFAWAAFTILYIIINNLLFDFVLKFMALFIAVVIAVAFAYHMLGVLGIEEDVWHTGFVIFPFAAVITGWISVCISKEKIRSSCYVQEQSKASS